MWVLLKAARKAYGQWRSLGREDRERLRLEADRVRRLVVELGGARAARVLDGADERLDEADALPTTRPRPEVTAELRTAVAALSRACADAGRQIIVGSTPRSARIGGRIARAAARRAAPMLEGRVRSAMSARESSKQAAAELVDDLFRRGGQLDVAGDVHGAEAAYREADALGDAEGAIRLGVLLRVRGDAAGALAAYARAEDRGHPEAASNAGRVLEDGGDVAGALEAYRRSDVLGSANAAINLGILLAAQGEASAAIDALERAENRGLTDAAFIIGSLLEKRGDLSGAEMAYRRADDAGNADAAYGLAAVLMQREDVAGATGAFRRAHERGHPGAGGMLLVLENADPSSPITKESGGA